MLRRGLEGPTEHIKVFQRYQPLISRQAERDVEQFLSEEHTFAEYEKETLKYKEISRELQYDFERVRTYIQSYTVHLINLKSPPL